jgi:Ran GTPase-activating protein (RanGAP) involved in mRNA processing and transport
MTLLTQKGDMNEELDFRNIADLDQYNKNYTNLKKLIIKRIVSDSLDELSVELASMTGLTTLEMCSCNITANFMGALEKLTALNELTIEYTKYDKISKTKFVNALTKALSQMKNLSRLHLSGNNIGKNCAVKLSTALPSLNNLTDFDLSGNFIGDKGACKIANAITLLQQTILSPNSKDINDILVNAIVNSKFREADTTIPFDERIRMTIRYLEHYIGKSNKLIKLDLGCNNISDIGAIMIGKALYSSKRLQVISLGENDEIGDDSAIAIAKALSNTKDLISINLVVNNIGDIGAKSLAEALKSLKGLKFLYLDDNKISEDGAKVLAEALPSMKMTINLHKDLTKTQILCFEK